MMFYIVILCSIWIAGVLVALPVAGCYAIDKDRFDPVTVFVWLSFLWPISLPLEIYRVVKDEASINKT